MTTSMEPTGLPVIDQSNDDISNGAPGGLIRKFKAALALNVGDAVLYSAVDTVTKTITTTDHDQRIGIVVGGAQTDMKALLESGDLGTPAAAAANEQVLVMISGIAYAKADANTVAFGDKVRLGTTTAGRVLDGADTTDTVAGITGLILGSALDSAAAAGDPVRVLIALG